MRKGFYPFSPRDQHGFAATTPFPLRVEQKFSPVHFVLLYLFVCKLHVRGQIATLAAWILKRRLPFGFSNTMNFIDSLTLIFLTLSAVKSAHIPKSTERGPHDVIPIMEVYNKSRCQPRELLVEILQEYPEEVEHIFIPSCVVLTRCAGYCNDEILQCMPTSTYNITMQIKRVKHHVQQNDIDMSFTEHSACECRQKTDVKEQKENVCEPCCDHCSERRKRLFVQDPATCRCSCKHTDEYCKERQLELNERTCKCDKPRR